MPKKKLDYSSGMPASNLVSSALAVMALEGARAAGLDTAELARRCEPSPSDLSDPDLSIPLTKFAALWTVIAQVPGGQGAGLQCLEMARWSLVGSLGYTIRNAETVGHALSMLVRHRRIVGEALLPRIQIGGGRLSLTAKMTRMSPSQATAFAQRILIAGGHPDAWRKE